MNILENKEQTLTEPILNTSDRQESTLNKTVTLFLSLTILATIIYSMYTTFFVVDGSAEDFVVTENMFWLTLFLDLTLPIGLFTILNTKKFYKPIVWLNTFYLLLLGIPLTLFILYFFIISIDISISIHLALIIGLYFFKKIYQIVCDPSKAKSQFIATYAAAVVGGGFAIALDLTFQHSSLYLSVISDTVNHFTSSQIYEARPPLTINMIPLLFYSLLMSSIIIEIFFSTRLKKAELILDHNIDEIKKFLIVNK